MLKKNACIANQTPIFRKLDKTHVKIWVPKFGHRVLKAKDDFNKVVYSCFCVKKLTFTPYANTFQRVLRLFFLCWVLKSEGWKNSFYKVYKNVVCIFV